MTLLLKFLAFEIHGFPAAQLRILKVLPSGSVVDSYLMRILLWVYQVEASGSIGFEASCECAFDQVLRLGSIRFGVYPFENYLWVSKI